MAKFAVLDGESIINTIIAESKAIAEEITGKICIKYTTEPAEPGGTYVNQIFIKRKPYPSWITDNYSGWKAPVEGPVFDPANPKYYTWNESDLSWVELPA